MSVVSDVFAKEPALVLTAFVLFLLVPVTGWLLIADPRTVDGINVWVKPLKFASSLSLYAATLAWFALWLPDSLRAESWYRPYVFAIVAAIFIEQIWLSAASLFAVRSHFNYDHPVFSAVYPIMGLIAIFLTSISLIYGVAILQNTAAPLSAPVRSAVGLGLIMTCVLTVGVAGTLAVGGPHLGGSPNGVGLPVFGWRLDGPDLRIAHFFATHAMHLLPATGWLFARVLPEKIATPAVFAAAGLYAAVVLGLFVASVTKPMNL